MFGLFSSVEKRTRDTAKHWVELAEKVRDFRSDQLEESELHSLIAHTEKLRALIKEKADASKLKLAMEALEPVLRQTGGQIYPRSTLQEYVDFALVGAIVILGVRAYFVQPFKIPTNSMWPTYHGMTPEVYPNPQEKPSAIEKAFLFLTQGASHYELVAPKAGRVMVPVAVSPSGEAQFLPERHQGRSFGILPSAQARYAFFIEGTERVNLDVPIDFDFSWMMRDAFGLDREKLAAAARVSKYRQGGVVWIELPIKAEAGKPFLAFDIHTGDNLFVDRFSYHFVKPEVGSAFVFRTRNIERIGKDTYYIKRLVGEPGDKLEIREPVLYRNGAPAEDSEAMVANNQRKGKYRGYLEPLPSSRPMLLTPGDVVEVPQHRYLALGDNSGNSADSRMWGFVPYKDIVGRPLMIYYPFTARWGVAK